MAGGMSSKRGGLTLAERAARSGIRPAPTPAGVRHCWVSGLPEAPGRWPGLLQEWVQRDGWYGRVVYAVEDAGRVVLIETLVAAEHLEPACRPSPAAGGT